MKVTVRSLRIVAAMVFVSLFLSGCYELRWIRYGTDDATRDSDEASCDRLARVTYPPMITRYMTREGYYEKGQMVCTSNGNGNQICREQGGKYHDPEFSEQDPNESARYARSRECMEDLGYQLITVKSQ